MFGAVVAFLSSSAPDRRMILGVAAARCEQHAQQRRDAAAPEDFGIWIDRLMFDSPSSFYAMPVRDGRRIDPRGAVGNNRNFRLLPDVADSCRCCTAHWPALLRSCAQPIGARYGSSARRP